VLHDAPRLPSDAAPQRRAQLRGDVDAIVGKALAKAPHERYASVAELDADVAAHLALKPIAIRAGERGYRARLFARRNALPVALAAVLALIVIGFGVVTLQQNERLAHERDQARQREEQAQFERARAQQVTDFVVGLFKAAKPEETRGREVTARQLLERGRQQLGGALAEQPQLKAAMLAAIAEASFSLDDLQGGYQAARESLALLDSLPSPPRRELALNLATLIRLENEFGKFSDALAYEERALALIDEMDVNARIELAMYRAVTMTGLARGKEATQLLRDALELQKSIAEPGDIRLVRIALRLTQKLPEPEAAALLKEYLPSNLASFDAEHPFYGDVLVGYSIYWLSKRNFDVAKSYAERAVWSISQVFGAGGSRVAMAKNVLATVLDQQGDDEESLKVFKEGLAIFSTAYGEVPTTARLEHNVGAMLVELRRVAEALPYLQRAVSIGSRSLAPENATLAFFRLKLGWALCELGRYDDAEAELRSALTTFERGRTGTNLIASRGFLACVAVKRDRRAAARAELSAAIEYLDGENADEVQRGYLRACLDSAKSL
ncbi:MAG TPA: tetratricopeptide repeat protein, partial [Tahibacter sp.]|nr:tetratricopeptide repeat protein [Tahibacter sp.]